MERELGAMHSRNLISALVAVLVLAGCSARENHAPTATLTASVTEGFAPLNVTITYSGSDVDGDELNMTLVSNDGWDAVGVSANRHGPSAWTTHATITYFMPETNNYTLYVTDGILTTKSQTITIRVVAVGGELRAEATVAESCSPCRGGLLGPISTLGAQGCTGFLSGKNETDCAWFAIHPAWIGRQFWVNGTNDADADLEFRDTCEPTGNRIKLSIHDGPEYGTIPPGTACAVMWTYNQAPATIEFDITLYPAH